MQSLQEDVHTLTQAMTGIFDNGTNNESRCVS